MSGVVWAAVAGVTFGLFQSVNRASLLELEVFESTFIQLLVSLVVLLLIVIATGEAARLPGVPPRGYLFFGLSGLVHFLGGWTLLNQSQKLIGAARTSPLLASTPLFGTVLAIVTLGQLPGALALVGMAAIIGGVTVVHLERIRREAPRRASGRPVTPAAPLFGLGTALAWAISPIFIRDGLAVVDSPLIGVTIGIFFATVAYGVVLGFRGRRIFGHALTSWPMLLKLAAGVLIGLATWLRWYALSVTGVTIVLSLGLLSVPTVMVFARLVAGRSVEKITPPVIGGAALVVAGALVIILPRVGGHT